MNDDSKVMDELNSTLDSMGFASPARRERSSSRRSPSPYNRRSNTRSRSPRNGTSNGNGRHSHTHTSTYNDDYSRRSMNEKADCPRLPRYSTSNGTGHIEDNVGKNVLSDQEIHQFSSPKPQVSEVADSSVKRFLKETDQYEEENHRKNEANAKKQENILTLRKGDNMVKLTLTLYNCTSMASVPKEIDSAELDALLTKYTDEVKKLLTRRPDQPESSSDDANSRAVESTLDRNVGYSAIPPSYASVTRGPTTDLPTPQEALNKFERNNRQEERTTEAYSRDDNHHERERKDYREQPRESRQLPSNPSTRSERQSERTSEPPKRHSGWPVQTILILGETGVGKSTWINGIANYLVYGSMNDAERYGQISMIPSEFQVADGRRMVTVRMGEPSKDEVMETGKSATQNAHVYELCDERNKRYLRLIDTPGIGDVRGTEVDALNFEKIIDCASQEKELNGICILLKPNNSRVSVVFKYCVFELLNHLSKSAAKNILFCFSNTRQTFYRPGDTMPILKGYLDDLRQQGGVKVQLDDYFCFDNESMRYLASVSCGVRVDDRERQAYEKSWQKSVEETEDLLKCISSLPPHNIADTVSVNKARKSIQVITRPLAQITRMIKENIDLIEEKDYELNRLRGDEVDLSERLIVPRYYTTQLEIDPVMMCTRCSYTEDVPTHEGVDTIPRNPCKNPCHSYFTYTSSVMNVRGDCKVCGCYASKHKIVKHMARKLKICEKDPMVERQIEKKQDSAGVIYTVLGQLTKARRDYESEQQIIQRCCAIFDEFLEKSSLLGHGESVAEYLKRLIQEEYRKDERCRDRRLIQNMEQQLNDYYDQRDMLESGRRHKDAFDGEATAAKVMQLEEKLKKMPMCGKMITEAFEASRSDYGAAQFRTSYFALGRDWCKKLYESSSSSTEKRTTERL